MIVICTKYGEIVE